MPSSTSHTCRYCRKKIVKEREGWRSDERALAVDRVRCPDSPEREVWKQKHEPAEMRPTPVIAPPARLEIWTGDAP